MSCPNWRELAHRDAFDRLGELEPEGWQEALLHLDSCKACWSEALAADPSLLFRRLSAPSAPIAALRIEADDEDAEVLAVQQAVAAMRTASRLERLEKSPRRGVLGRSWREWAAAAALVTAVGGFGSWYEWNRPSEIVPEALPPPGPAALAMPAARLIEGLDRSYSQVKELGGKDGDDFTGAMIYDPSLDV